MEQHGADQVRVQQMNNADLRETLRAALAAIGGLAGMEETLDLVPDSFGTSAWDDVPAARSDPKAQNETCDA